MPLHILLGLISCNLIWALNPVAGKIMMTEFTPLQTGWMRYAVAVSTYLVFSLFSKNQSFAVPKRKIAWIWLVLFGFFPFCFTTLLNMKGLSLTRATDNALIIAMEPLMTILAARILVGERMSRIQMAGLMVAMYGFSLLSELTLSQISGGIGGSSLGNILILISLIGEACYSSFTKLLMREGPSGRMSGQSILGSGFVIGFVLLTLSLLFLGEELPVVSIFKNGISLRVLAASFYIGGLGTALTYLFWMKALERASIPSVALSLFVQPLAGALGGSLFLGETLTLSQKFGGFLILASLAVSKFTDSARKGLRSINSSSYT